MLGPAGMKRTTWTAKQPAAIGYLVHPYADVPRQEPVIDDGATAPAGQLWSTPSDLCRWAAFIAAPDPAVLAPETVEEMRTFQSMVDLTKWRLGYGLGFALYRVEDDVFVGHDGAHAGFLAHVSCLPSKRTGAAVLTNDGAGVTISALGIQLSRAVAEAFPPAVDEWRPGEGAAARARGHPRPLVDGRSPGGLLLPRREARVGVPGRAPGSRPLAVRAGGGRPLPHRPRLRARRAAPDRERRGGRSGRSSTSPRIRSRARRRRPRASGRRRAGRRRPGRRIRRSARLRARGSTRPAPAGQT